MATADPARAKVITPLFLAITGASLAYFISFGALIPVLPLYAKHALGAGPLGVGVAVGAFSFTAFFLRPMVGRLGDRRGRRLLIVAGAAIVLVSVIGLIPAASMPVLVGFRLLMGVGEAMFFVGAMTAINDIAPDERRGEAVSLFTIALYGGLAIGPVLGETVLGESRYDAAWLTSAGLAGVALLVGFFIPDTRSDELRANRPARGRLVHRAGLLPGVLLMTSVVGFAGFNAFLALYSRALGFRNSGLVFLTYAVVVLLIRSVGRRIPDVFGFERAAQVALLFSSLGLATIALWQDVAGMFVGAIVFSVGQGLAFPSLMAMAVSAAPPTERGSVVGTFTMFFDVSFGIGAITLGAVNRALGTDGMFLTAAAAAFAGFVILSVRGRRRRVSEPVPEPIGTPLGA